ncbi:MAG: hypothetical protein LH647_08405 [Leptolyngbyaceae cyanobacterium CAN_BIN12]|nr:hypothetical protein [Leptolyngbyaceae cyanobacterium CAN_BIN12]
MGTGGAGANVGGVAGVPACGGIAGAGIGRGGAIAGGAIAGGGVVSGIGRGGAIAMGNWNGCAGLLYCFKVASTVDHS